MPARSFLGFGVRGQRSSGASAAPTEKDVIAGGVAAAANAFHKAVNRAAAAAAGGLHGPARDAKPDGTRHNRNAARCKPSRWGRGRSSRAGHTDATARRQDFRPGAYPRCRVGPCRSSRQAAPTPVATGEEPGDVADSGGLAPGGAAGRGRCGGTSAGPASAASGGPLADRQYSNSGTAAVPAGRGGRSL